MRSTVFIRPVCYLEIKYFVMCTRSWFILQLNFLCTKQRGFVIRFKNIMLFFPSILLIWNALLYYHFSFMMLFSVTELMAVSFLLVFNPLAKVWANKFFSYNWTSSLPVGFHSNHPVRLSVFKCLWNRSSVFFQFLHEFKSP